jgi:uncharacterized protein (DUF433 family)
MAGLGLYRGQDPREIPAYSIAEAAYYLQLPPSTLRSWVRGRAYPTKGGQKHSAPLLRIPAFPEHGSFALSFVNIVEAHVLGALRRHHHVSMPKVREALNYLETRFSSKHPLIEQEFETDGIALFVQHYGQLIDITADGQLTMQEAIRAHLRRVDRDPAGLPMRFYPFARDLHATEAKIIVIDPRISFGRPVLAGTGIVTSIIAERYCAGESIDDLAQDYGRSRMEIEEVIRCEHLLSKAA